MEYQIEYATESDAFGLAEINTLSFQTRSVLFEVFPGASQPALRDYKAIYAMKHFANPQTHVLKITDAIDGKITGYCRWQIPETLGAPSLPVLSERNQKAAEDPIAFAPRPMNEALYNAFRQLLQDARKRHATEDDIS